MTAERLDKVRGHTSALLSAFLGLRLNYGLLKPLLGDPDSYVEQPPPGVLANGLSAIRNTLFFACVSDVVKLAWDTDGRTPSVVNLMTAVRNPEVVNLVTDAQAAAFVVPRESGDAEHEGQIQAIEDTARKERQEHVDHLLHELAGAWANLESATYKDAFRTMRDKHIAHFEVRPTPNGHSPLDISSLGIRRRDLGEAIAALEHIVGLLTAVIRDAHFAMDHATQMFDRHGASFWKAFGLSGGPGTDGPAA